MFAASRLQRYGLAGNSRIPFGAGCRLISTAFVPSSLLRADISPAGLPCMETNVLGQRVRQNVDIRLPLVLCLRLDRGGFRNSSTGAEPGDLFRERQPSLRGLAGDTGPVTGAQPSQILACTLQDARAHDATALGKSLIEEYARTVPSRRTGAYRYKVLRHGRLGWGRASVRTDRPWGGADPGCRARGSARWTEPT